MESVLSRFLRYVSFDTQSEEASETCPSTDKQKLLGTALVEEMRSMGIADAAMDRSGYVYGTVPGTKGYPVIGLIAHMDTAAEASGANVQARVAEFDGKPILLNAEKEIWLDPKDYPILHTHEGKHLVVTDGTTLLGADDKAGIAEILTAAQTLLTCTQPHATLKIGFTPDEEIGRGADRFDLARFGADFAYTVDGGTLGEIEYENFNAASAGILVHGRSIHPGSAKGKMKNAQRIAMELDSLLPAFDRPEYTEGYEGFFHLTNFSGDVELAQMHYIIRDHDREKFEQKKKFMTQTVSFLNQKYGENTLELTLRDSYYNMKTYLEPHMDVVERARKAMAKAGMTVREVPIRGGTDGARLSAMGLPCPNLCTGGENYHGRFEFIPVEDMQCCVRMLEHLILDVEETK